jgi:erythromycin esterase-like protein
VDEITRAISNMSFRDSGHDELINEMREERKDRAKKIEELEGVLNQQKVAREEMKTKYEEKLESVKDEIIEQTEQQVQKTFDERPPEVHYHHHTVCGIL